MSDALVERLAGVAAGHRIAVWSDHTYGCRSCAKRYEQTSEPFEMGEYARLSKPDWTYEQAMAHLARALLPVVEQEIAAARAEALREAADELGHIHQADSAGASACIRWLRDRAARIARAAAQPATSPEEGR